MHRPCLFLLLLTVSVVAAGPGQAESRLTLSEAEFDFGYAPQNSKVSHVFKLYATGDEPVKITEVKPGCGCTQAPLEKDYLEPGDSTSLEITFSTGRYVNRTVKRAAVAIENDPQQLTLDIISYVVTRPDSNYPLMLKPYKVDLSQYGATVRDRSSFDITNISPTDLRFTMISGPDAFGSVNFPETIGAGETVTVEFVLNPENIRESFERSFTFEVDDENHSRYTIPVRRRYHDPNAATLTAPGK